MSIQIINAKHGKSAEKLLNKFIQPLKYKKQKRHEVWILSCIQRVNGKVESGVVLITSANFTKPRFKGGNIEFGYISTKKRDLISFEHKYDYLWDKIGTDDISKAIFKQNDFTVFPYHCFKISSSELTF